MRCSLKKILILFCLVILLAGSVCAIDSITKIYVSEDGGNNWNKKITIPNAPYGIKEIYIDDNGDLYFIISYGGVNKIPYGSSTPQNFNDGLIAFRPYGIDRLNNELIIWGEDFDPYDNSIYRYNGESWIGIGLGNGKTYGVVKIGDNPLWASWLPQSYSGYPMVIYYGVNWGTFGFPGEFDIIKSSDSAAYRHDDNTNVIRVVTSSWGSRGYDLGWREINDLEVTSSGDGLFIIEKNSGDLTQYSNFNNFVYKAGPNLNFLEINEDDNKIAVSSNTEVKIYDINENILSNPVLDVSGQSGYNIITALEANGNNIAVGVKYFCKNSDNDDFSGEYLEKYGEVICQNLDCNDDDPYIYSGALEECNGYDDNCGEGLCDISETSCKLNSDCPSGETCQTIDEGCGCVVGEPNQLCSDLDPNHAYGVCVEAERVCGAGTWSLCEDDYSGMSGYMPIENTETACKDDLDNDCDGTFDCSDDYEDDCMFGGFCYCTDDLQCGEGKVCENTCINACVNDDDCESHEFCNLNGHCDVTIPSDLTVCSDTQDYCDLHGLSEEDCIMVCINVDVDPPKDGPFDCYWNGECIKIDDDTICSDLTDSGAGLCEANPHILCSWDGEECDDGSLPTVGCIDGESLCSDGTCQADCGTNFNCNNDGSCDSGEGCDCDDCIKLMDGCEPSLRCGDNGCELIPDSYTCGEDQYSFLADECTEKGEYCMTLQNNIPVNAVSEIDGEECCFGECWEYGDFEFDSVTGELIFYTSGDCVPLESGSSEGQMTVYENGVESGTQPCTILPSKKVPFISGLSILIGLSIIILFYVLRRKH